MTILKISIIFTIFATAISIMVGSHIVNAQTVAMDIHKAKDPGPGFGNETIGSASFDTHDNTLDISINMTAVPKQDKVFEAWLVDAGGSNYKLSLGAIAGDSLKTSQRMLNPYTYTQLIITEEPRNDVDPNAAGTYGGVDLPPPFGR
jgi:hypothetical protein